MKVGGGEGRAETASHIKSKNASKNLSDTARHVDNERSQEKSAVSWICDNYSWKTAPRRIQDRMQCRISHLFLMLGALKRKSAFTKGSFNSLTIVSNEQPTHSAANLQLSTAAKGQLRIKASSCFHNSKTPPTAKHPNKQQHQTQIQTRVR